jgi:hypothetical protein
VNGAVTQSAQYYFDNAQEAHAVTGVLANTLADNAIYLDNETYVKINDYAKAAMTATGEYLTPLHPLVRMNPPEQVLAAVEAGRAALREVFEREMKPLAMELAGIFRKQLRAERAPADKAPRD